MRELGRLKSHLVCPENFTLILSHWKVSEIPSTGSESGTLFHLCVGGFWFFFPQMNLSLLSLTLNFYGEYLEEMRVRIKMRTRIKGMRGKEK